MALRTIRLILIAIAIAIAGCGNSTTSVKTVVETVSAPAAPPAPVSPVRPHRSHRQSTTLRPPAAPVPTNPVVTAGYRACDAQIAAKIATTTCGFAENAFYGYWVNGQSSPIDVYSPSTATTYPTDCTAGEVQVVCTTSDDGSVKFTQHALDRYTQSQADHYAANADLGPDPRSAPSDPGPSGPGPSTSTDTAPATPDYTAPAGPGPNPSNEIPNYDNGTGSVVQCADGQYSHSGGRPGACSSHGGVG